MNTQRRSFLLPFALPLALALALALPACGALATSGSARDDARDAPDSGQDATSPVDAGAPDEGLAEDAGGPTAVLDAYAPAEPVADAGPGLPPARACEVDDCPWLRVTRVRVTNTRGEAPVKGDTLRVAITLSNPHAETAKAALVPLFTSKRFTDFTRVAVGVTPYILVGAGSVATVSFEAPPLGFDRGTKKSYAFGAGDYDLDGVAIGQGRAQRLVTDFPDKGFTIAPSSVVFQALIAEPEYLATVGFAGRPAEWATHAYGTRTVIFTPNTPEDTVSGTYEEVPGGFDALTRIPRVVGSFSAKQTFPISDDLQLYLRQSLDDIAAVLGLPQQWDSGAVRDGTRVGNHGYDIATRLSANFEIGGAGPNFALPGIYVPEPTALRTALQLTFSTAYLFDAQECAPKRGFVMCSGETHPRYKSEGVFVWLRKSVEEMRNPYL